MHAVTFILLTLQDTAEWRNALYATDFQNKVRFISLISSMSAVAISLMITTVMG